ncbi:hypothetical protein [Chromobacterium haemolyticum]|uniref:hypothetical protein n=1 Tax=Chromobacterium haemolyticum TaxID=394935 RepID=UPI0009D976CD|nr:hypothetical protein [Chromobacterium haemolyticum]OQS33859.1 hypothetical protein B0T39_20265 [Chromobacterium haemolyticum]
MQLSMHMPVGIGQSKMIAAEAMVRDGALEQAAIQFEALLISRNLAEMRKSIRAINPDSSEARERTAGEVADFIDQQFAGAMAEQRAFGVADYLIKTMTT